MYVYRTFHRVIFEKVDGAFREIVPFKNLLAFVEGGGKEEDAKNGSGGKLIASSR